MILKKYKKMPSVPYILINSAFKKEIELSKKKLNMVLLI